MAGQTGLQPILARQLPFWDRLTPRERALVLERSGMVHYDPGQNIRGRSMECVGTLLVQQGSLRIYLLSDEGREVTVYRVGPGEICILAAACVLDGIDFDMQIDAEEACEAILIPADLFSTLTEENIYVENFSYKLASEQFSAVMDAVQRMLFLSLEQRLAAFLIDESGRTGSPDIRLTQGQMARAIGSAREAVSRILKQMAADGVVVLFRGGVTIADKAALYRLL